MKRMLIASTAVALAGATAASAAVQATATTDLNLRAGPGAWHEVIGVIDANGQVSVEQCYEEANWCEVTYDGKTGWAYGAYLSAEVDSAPVAIVAPAARQALQIRTITREDNSDAVSAAVGAGWGAVAGSLIAGPAGAAAGAVIAAPVAAAADTDTEVTTYVIEHPVDPVYLDGELMVGVGVPEDITVYPVPVRPEPRFAYLNINGTPVIIDTTDRRVVRIIR